jgi:hypothetical protein
MAIVLSFCAAYVVYCLATNPAGPMTTPDSIHYMNVSPIVPLGYPFFLKIVGARGSIVAQPIVFGAALAFLGREIVRTTRSTWLAVSVIAATIVVPQIREFHASVLSESLFLSLLIVFLALGIRVAYHPSWHLMVLVATAAGAAATVRRTGFALVPVMLLMVLLQRHRLTGSPPALFFIAAVAPFAFIVGAEQAAAPVVHAGQSSSLMGRHLFAKAALIEAPPAPPSADPLRRSLDAHLEESYAPIRALLAQAPPDVRAVLTIYYETCLQGGCAGRSRGLMPDRSEPEQTATLGAAGLARIRRAPLSFARLTALHYGSLWTVNRLRHPDTARTLNDFIASHRPLPFEAEAFSLPPDGRLEFQPAPAVRYLQLGIFAVALFTGALAVIGCVAAVRTPRLPPAFAVAAVSALAAHGGLLLTALLAAGFTRFMLGLWPAIVLACAFGARATLQEIRRSRESGTGDQEFRSL